MKILFLGFGNPNHAAMYMKRGFETLGHTVRHVTDTEIILNGDMHLSTYYEGEDFVYIFHLNTVFLLNDLTVPVVLYMFELLWRPCLDHCDILVMSTPLMENYYVYYYPHLLTNNPAKYIQYYGVDLDRFDATGKKKYLTCSFMGNLVWEEKTWVEKDMYKTRKRVVEACESYLDLMPHDDYEEYISYLKHSQSTLIVHGKSCYISQRIFEAAAASCCPIIYVDDEVGQEIYDSIGLMDHVNCIFLVADRLPEAIKDNAFKFTVLGQNARKWVETHHNIHNCTEIITYVENYQKYRQKSMEQRCLRATRAIESELGSPVQNEH